MNVIPHNKPMLTIEDEKSLVEVVRSGYIAQGKKVKLFENEFARLLGIQYSVAVSSGTTALYLALRNYVKKKKDEVIIPSYVCTALLNAIYMAGGTPKIVDVDPIDFNISKTIIDEAISNSVKVIIIPHIHGVPVVIDRTGWRDDIGIIEDCATAVGSMIDGQYVGNFGDIAIFSFYATKFITTGQGGMILTNDEKIASGTLDYREFDNPEKYYPRFNFQMTDIQAGLGSSQLLKVESFIERRKLIAAEYKKICAKKGWKYHCPRDSNIVSNHYRFIIRLEESHVNRLKQYLLICGIKTIVPIEGRELLHNYLSLNKKYFQSSEMIAKTTLSLPIYPSLSEEDLSTIITSLNNY